MLREVRPDDLPILFEHQRDAKSVAMAAVPSRGRPEFDAHWERILRDPDVVVRTIEHDAAVVGSIGSFLEGGRRMVGYWIGRPFWGRGIATTALRDFLDVLAERPLYATVAAHNAASLRVLERSGFARAGEQTGEDGVTLIVFVLRG